MLLNNGYIQRYLNILLYCTAAFKKAMLKISTQPGTKIFTSNPTHHTHNFWRTNH